MKTAVKKTLLAGCLVLALGPAAQALCMFDAAPPCAAYWRYPVVFIGTAREVVYSPKYRRGEGDEAWDYRRRVARFTVEKVFKGARAGRVEAVAEEMLPTEVTLPSGEKGLKSSSHSDCDFVFEAGQRYLVYASPSPDGGGALTVGLNRTRKVADAAEDFEFIYGLARAAPSSKIYGKVERADARVGEDGGAALPVANVRVTATGGGQTFAALTDAAGRYVLEGLPPGGYAVAPSLPPHLTREGGPQLAKVVARGCAEMDFYTQVDGRVGGSVYDEAGRPLPEIKVDLIPADGAGVSPNGLSAYTDKGGAYEFKQVPPGRYLLGVHLGGPPDERLPHPRTYFPGADSQAAAGVLELAEGERLAGRDLRLPPRYAARSLEVVVTWPDGRPAEDATVSLENAEYFWSATSAGVVRLDEAGRYKAAAFEGVNYWVHAHVNLKDGGQMHAEPVNLTPSGEERPVKLVIASPGGSCQHYPGGRNGRRRK